LVRVCVIGGGTAGDEAAFEAQVMGAEVTVVERRTSPEPAWSTWPDLISELPREASLSRAERKPSSPTITAEAKSAGRGSVVLSDGRRVRCDTVVLTTGSRFLPAAIPGARKTGVFILDGCEKYSELGRSSPSINEAVVTGEGFRGLEVADRLSARGVKVSLFISCWQREHPSAVAFGVIEEAADERGVRVQMGGVARAVGNGVVEAAVVAGSVLPCDALVVVPPRAPNPIHSDLGLGWDGGVVVDRTMQTTVPSMLAAGGCAELAGCAHGWGALLAEPSLSGRIAGSNCLGSRRSIGGTRVDELRVFGLRWSWMGRRGGAHGVSGGRVEIVSRRWGPACACAIAHEQPSENVVCVESVQPWTSLPAGLPPLGAGVTLESLAYGLGSSDISLVSETARLGLRDWPKS